MAVGAHIDEIDVGVAPPRSVSAPFQSMAHRAPWGKAAPARARLCRPGPPTDVTVRGRAAS